MVKALQRLVMDRRHYEPISCKRRGLTSVWDMVKAGPDAVACVSGCQSVCGLWFHKERKKKKKTLTGETCSLNQIQSGFLDLEA